MIIQLLSDSLTVVGSFGAIYSGYSWWMQRRRTKQLDQPITLRISDQASDETLHTLDIRLPRRSVTRSEALGLLGMLPTLGNKRFSCAYVQTQDFVNQLDAIYEGRSSVLTFPFTADEFDVFAI